MKSRVTFFRLLLSTTSIALAAAIWVPVSMGARGGGRGGGGRGGGTITPGKSKDGCHHKSGRTTKHKHQPFLLYSGKFSGQPNGFYLTMVIDRCKKTPKVASFQAYVPGYSCNNGLEAAPAAIAWDGFDSGGEPKLHNGTFNFTVNVREAGTSTQPPFDLSGTVSGKVKIPKRGRGKGSSRINGSLEPPYCPGLPPLQFSIKFKRTYSYLIRGDAG